MTAWPRNIEPQQASSFSMPGALQSWTQTGKAQHRATALVGRIWSESYPPFKASSAFGRELVAAINNVWRNGVQIDIDHYSYLTTNGGGTGTVTINGANQTGSSVVTAGWGGTNPVLKSGDIIRLPGISNVFDVIGDINHSAGAATIPINPPIFVGASPTNGGTVTYNAVRLNAFIADAPNIPNAGPDGFIAGLTISFREAP